MIYTKSVERSWKAYVIVNVEKQIFQADASAIKKNMHLTFTNNCQSVKF